MGRMEHPRIAHRWLYENTPPAAVSCSHEMQRADGRVLTGWSPSGEELGFIPPCGGGAAQFSHDDQLKQARSLSSLC
ncbi:hypothetical protein SRHO_G00008560 [Serrasalmus rhombeus]